jgi:hypothetical protein
MLRRKDALAPSGKWGIKTVLGRRKEDSNYVFPEIKLRGLVQNFHIYTSVSDLYIPGIGLPILLQPNRQTDRGNIEIAHINWD